MKELNFTWRLYKINSLIGWILWKIGKHPNATTSIAETTEIGYGPEYDGFFKYPAPREAYSFSIKGEEKP
jgi:hypothetical protein